MDLGGLTKQLAQQAIASATQEPAPAPAVPGGNAGVIILNQIGAMQSALKDDEELLVFYHAGPERIRVLEIYLPTPQVAVLTGLDANRALTRVISAVEALQLVTRTAKVQPGAKSVKVNLVIPKSKDSSRK
jgi:hypothetical protein